MAFSTQRTIFQPVNDHDRSYSLVMAMLACITGFGLVAAYYMEHHGHYITGMNNQIVWGLPHVFAIFLIISASGALNVASIASVFSKNEYKPLSRLSGLLSIGLLLGGLGVLVLDLGRPDRLITAMTHFNFKSIFSWNIVLYIGFLVVVTGYLMTMLTRSWTKYSRASGTLAFVWRIVLTTGTGSIFGFLVAREAYDTAILVPMFISASLSLGTAMYILVIMWIYKSTARALSDVVLDRLKRLNAVFSVATLFFVLIYHLTSFYATEHQGLEKFILVGGNVYTFLFWYGQVLLGTVLPVVIFWWSHANTRFLLILGALMIILGGFSMIYVVVVGGQAYPLELIPGVQVSSAFGDGQPAAYTPSLPEFLLGLGGVAFALLLTLFTVKILPFVPQSLAEKTPDQTY